MYKRYLKNVHFKLRMSNKRYLKNVHFKLRMSKRYLKKHSL